METKERIQSLALEADYHQRQAQDIQTQLQSLQLTDAEIERSKEALKNIKEGKTALFSLSSGVFASGELKDINRLLLNVGSGIFVEKDIDSVVKFLDERKEDIASARNDLLKGMQAISLRLRDLDKELRELLKEEKE